MHPSMSSASVAARLGEQNCPFVDSYDADQPVFSDADPLCCEDNNFSQPCLVSSTDRSSLHVLLDSVVAIGCVPVNLAL